MSESELFPVPQAWAMRAHMDGIFAARSAPRISEKRSRPRSVRSPMIFSLRRFN